MNPIFPSILSDHFYDIESRLLSFASCGIETIHLDVMDGHFVPNLSFGPAMIRDIKSIFPFQVDAHLMVTNPNRMIPWFLEAGADWISIHLELKDQIQECLSLLKGSRVKTGLVLNPDTPVQTAFPYLEIVDYVLLMSVFPGYGGQEFIPDTIPRIRSLRDEIQTRKTHCLIQVDGGVNQSNSAQIADAGADLIVVGSALGKSQNIKEMIHKLKQPFGEST